MVLFVLVVFLVFCVLLCRVLSFGDVEVVCSTVVCIVCCTESCGFFVVGSRDVLRDCRFCVLVVSDVLRDRGLVCFGMSVGVNSYVCRGW